MKLTNGGTMYEQRDVVLIPFPYTDMTGQKLRPGLIISNKRLNTSEDRICCLVTSSAPRDGVPINAFEKGKLPFTSWVKPHRLFTINQRIIKKKLCTVSQGFHDRLVKEVEKYIH
ncbi:MAG: type II toxin-antitoxin system PemK/MazF family toxin [Nanoarchaeota archaeon]